MGQGGREGRKEWARTRGIGRSCCHCCVCLKIVTNAPSVHFMASAINKMLQHSALTLPLSLSLSFLLSSSHTHQKMYVCVCNICANNMAVLRLLKVVLVQVESPRTAAGCQTNNNINFVSYILWVYRNFQVACVYVCVRQVIVQYVLEGHLSSPPSPVRN